MRVLVFGATGYVGGRIVAGLVGAGHAVTGFARDGRGVARVRSLGAAPIQSGLDDTALLRDLLEAHDQVVWAAQLMLDAEQAVVGALLAGLRNSGKTLLFISGTAVLSERTDGAWSEAVFAEDEDFTPRRQLQLRVETEQMVRQAAMDQGVRGLVVRPPVIWGHGGSTVIADLHHSARATGAVCYVGAGLNCYSNVHVDDVAALVVLALEAGTPGALYHCVSGEVDFRTMAEAVAAGRGLGTRSLSVAEAEAVWGRAAVLIVFGASSRSRCPRARSDLGWSPDPARLDVLGECANRAYMAVADRPDRSWERK